jgi:hypothetical protein
VKILLPLLLLATLGMLAALPHIAAADDQGDQGLNDGAHHQTDHETAHDDENENGYETLAEFHIGLTGDQQVPSVTTSAFGFAQVRLFQNGTSTAIEFRVVVCNIVNVTASHIHVGASGTDGPVVVPFFGSPSGPFSSPHGCSTLAHDIRGPGDLVPRPEVGIANWTDFVHALQSGNAYVNVHTTAHPGGEIRGQLVSEQDQDDDQGDE